MRAGGRLPRHGRRAAIFYAPDLVSIVGEQAALTGLDTVAAVIRALGAAHGIEALIAHDGLELTLR